MGSVRNRSSRWDHLLFMGYVVALLAAATAMSGGTGKVRTVDPTVEYNTEIRPLLRQYCFACHSSNKKKGDLDLERFDGLDRVREDLGPWQSVVEMLDNGAMPPRKSGQPSAEERRRLLAWTRGLLATEARARAGDPGRVVVRRLSNAEYNNTVRDLIGVDLQPARDFPVDGAAGEGFTNAGDALATSSTLLNKYLNAAKEIVAHTVLLPDGFRFSPAKTRRDWTDEVLAELRAFYAQNSSNGRLPLRPYLMATLRHRDDLRAGRITLEAVAEKDKLSPKYLRILWECLNDETSSFPLDGIRARWQQAKPEQVDALVADIAAWQAALWRFVPIGSYRYGNTIRQLPNVPGVVPTHQVKVQLKPAPGQKEIVLYLVSREFPATREGSFSVWRRPRLEGGGKAPLLLRDHAPSRITPAAGSPRDGLEWERFGHHPQGKPVEEASLVVPATSVLKVCLPAAQCRDRFFVVEGQLDPGGGDRAVQFQVRTAPPKPQAVLDGTAPLVAAVGSETAKRLLHGFETFRRCFPLFICYARVIPDDEGVCLKLFHREDDLLIRLFLDEARTKQLDRLWRDLRFISRYPVTEHKQLPLFIGFVTQDQPKELLAYFESQREPFRKRAEAFLQEEENAAPRQRHGLLDFAARAYRRPLHAEEKTELLRLYDTLHQKGLPHEEALRTVLTRVLIAPSFLFRIEQVAAGKNAQPVSSWELATRLSYFLWASMPDAELRQAASQGRLHDPDVLSGQVERMLKDPKVRGLASEFGTQWLHVRDIQQNREKNEKLFPTFDDALRAALYEESVLFFQDLFQSDRRLPDLLDADYTFLNETLARHYGIPGVAGPQWRRVSGVRKYGRGGVLALGSVLTKQSGASRTSPVLRGNWLVETMLGEKLPKPPPNVPRLPEEETGNEGSVRQMVEKHARIAECAVCHQRIDPFGFSLEKYDPIGRFRDKDLGGRLIDTNVSLKDGTKFEGIDGLRHYLVTRRGEEFQRHFCQKLLGYALGRAVVLSDQPLLDDMMVELKKNDFRLSVAVKTIVRSKPFRYHRGMEATKGE